MFTPTLNIDLNGYNDIYSDPIEYCASLIGFIGLCMYVPREASSDFICDVPTDCPRVV